MASMSSLNAYSYNKLHSKHYNIATARPIILSQQQQPKDDDKPTTNAVGRREIVLRSSELAVVGAIFNFRYAASNSIALVTFWDAYRFLVRQRRSSEFVCQTIDLYCCEFWRSGKKPDYLGVQKSQQSLALCPATKNCISTSESITDLTHYAPPWNYNPEEGRGRKKPVSREVAMEELLQVIKSTKPDKFTPRIVEKKVDYVRVEYQSPVLGLVDDVEFWFPPGKDSIVEYRSASRLGNFDFDYNRKRIKALRLELEKKGWASQDSF
ncbi:hypothetical protein FEM48_Zijuj08G0051500 [Ziziphus jujuba var. spinosa]|uniref:Uncharacterized protein n=1 Tax=Ziziphus jujuba var. spinosa TaxID=714518 RepID=A0A978UX59_ZIZJJ|nr:hypothetical protein FEM48_Zijuj08G0051500 [Ziziphus jujuba var. spinosa]